MTDREHRPANNEGHRPSFFSVHAILNRVFLVLVLAATAFLASLEVTAADRLRVPWAGRELPETCEILRRTGQPCPSCGATRSVVAALHGDFARSRQFHFAGIAIAAMLVGQCVMRVAFLWPSLRYRAVDVVVSAVMLGAFAALVNRW